jgi:thymidylate synthase (FAD)
MQIVEPYAKMLPPAGRMTDDHGFTQMDGMALLRHVEWCSRISHRSEDAQNADSWKRIIQNVVIEHGDWSVTEHASVSVDAYVDRGITHEWVRHRMGAYTQESTRFVNYQKKMAPSFVSPFVDAANTRVDAAENWQALIEHSEMCYQDLISKGCAPQIARSVFPNALASRLIVTYNLRNWRHFFIMRTTKEAHPQMRQVTIPLLAEFKAKIPLLYDDIEPNAKQSESMKKAR